MDQICQVDFCECHQNQIINNICLDIKCEQKQRFICSKCKEDNIHSKCNVISLDDLSQMQNNSSYESFLNQKNSSLQSKIEMTYESIFQIFEKYIEDVTAQIRRYLKFINLRYANLFQFESQRVEYFQQIQDSVFSNQPLSIKNIAITDILNKFNDQEQLGEEIFVLQNNLKIELNDINELLEKLSKRLSFDKVSYNYVTNLDSQINPFKISLSRKEAVAVTSQSYEPCFSIIEPPLASQKISEITLQIFKKGKLGISIGIISTQNQKLQKFQNALGVDSDSKYIYQCGNKGNCYLVDNYRQSWSDINGIQFDTGDIVQIIYDPQQQTLQFLNTTKNTQCTFDNIQNLSIYKDYYSFFISSVGSNHEIKILY
ncbi:hypothetical protein TTHERM_00600800 (macronuclear) [Tetrahymena thermophila SB210]|uniref:SPRY domain-containing protein n=1 Tax=Tetrahymena thermophila (strain SB210) TaxID=312017 RepID=I7MCT3_TETTS|nr:hypothetical protein TTHERM_00600800 [Tetrahymena thermophila SB210]EAR84888.2 hypothetical protein TTHERM_00600800 [Tetrahymena thermophila SB210]|eukprot:XP_001032551.2 hypothetical protein TTHERM_00600800 [Tetrahymena thermophila SB210]